MDDKNIHSGHRKRLRERYEAEDFRSFQDHEILEFLLTFTIPRGDTNPIGHRLLKTFGSLSDVFQASKEALKQVKGVGPHSALLLQVCGSIARRLARDMNATPRMLRIETPADAARCALSLFFGAHYERCYLICLNRQRLVLHTALLAEGTIAETPIYPRRVVELALQHHAHDVILTHNHPSGDPSPSKQDIEITQTVRDALSLIGIQLYDHLIVGTQRVFSFNQEIVIHFEADGSTYFLPLQDSQAREALHVSRPGASSYAADAAPTALTPLAMRVHEEFDWDEE